MPSRSFFCIFKDAAIRGRILMVLAVIGILIVAILLSGPKPTEYSLQDTSSAQSGEVLATPISEVDEEYDLSVTTGVLVGAAAVLLIIEAGTLLELKRNS